MIKLNNKNITYVALADSSNSLKAPKEIWYADSNNSVKLVYRRKDALIEGEDYEKYHWLVGDADAYINTLKYYRPYDDSVQMTFRDNLYPNRVNKYNKHNAEEQIWGCSMKGTVYSIRSYISGTDDNSNKISNNILDARTTDGNVNWGAYAIGSFINASPEHSLYMSSVDSNTDNYYFIYNGDTKDNLSTRYTLPELIEQDVLVFYNASVTNGYFNGSFFNFIHYRNNVEITHLIPCKLLKPVPKWLDANGIRRQVGECGMIDLVSGKFYGNVNSNGTFTVENYYERKEWLETDLPITNTTYMELPINSATFSFNRIFERVVNSTLFVTTRYSYYVDIVNNSTFTKIWDIPNAQEVFRATTPIVIGESISINSTESELYVNNETIPVYENTNIIIRFRQSVTSSALGSKFKTSTISVNGVERYIPCTLTMDLPASMDANNIARTKGTSGMWDLVSDRFYGNVANSGTFKAVNLAEGVDYEVHQWLVSSVNEGATLPANVAYITLPTPISLDNKLFTITMGSVHRDLVIYGSVVDGLQYVIVIYTYSSGVTTIQERHGNTNIIHRIDGTLSGLKSVTLDFRNKVATVGNNSFNIDGVGYQFRGTNTTSWGSTKTIGNITIDNELNLVPVKLLRSIPSKYDANGIARQAGECGMYDTVNDVFYGNVASSGSFTVEDDD